MLRHQHIEADIALLAEGQKAKPLRSLIVERAIRGETGEIEWGKVWKLAKMAFKYFTSGENKL